MEKKYEKKWYHVYNYCSQCAHRNDTHDMNCIECCPVKKGNIRESEEEFCDHEYSSGTQKNGCDVSVCRKCGDIG